MSDEEKDKIFNKNKTEAQAPLSQENSSNKYSMVSYSTDGIPESLDWRDSGAVTAVKDQWHPNICGSCWAFAGTGVLEGAYKIAGGDLLSFSE